MDPQASLDRLRELLVVGQDLREEDVEEVAELFEALDDWLKRGGFLPREWSKSRSMPETKTKWGGTRVAG